MKDELLDYVKAEKRKGFDDYSIVSKLVAAGYLEEEILEALKHINRGKFVSYALVAAAIIAVVGLLSLLVYRFIGGPEKALNIDYEFSNSEINSLGNALDRQDLAACENAGQLSNYCEGVLEQNTEKCKRYGGDLGDACIMRIANKNKDPTLCGNLQVLKGLCFAQLAMETGDIRLCDAAEEYKNDCKTAAIC